MTRFTWKSLAILATAGLACAQLPPNVTDLISVNHEDGRGIRYKETQICETTEGVKGFSGYIDVAEDKHMFFWFFESRNDPSTAPITMWLNGGPGGDSLSGLFDELGPCTVLEDLTTELNPNAWNEVSNMLFLSQPIGVGFSYGSQSEIEVPIDEEGTLAPARYAAADYRAVNLTEHAAADAWNALNIFYEALPDINPDLTSRTFHLAAQSYGGHTAPGFFNHFRKQNAALIAEGAETPFELGTLIIVSGLIDAYLQQPGYVKFAEHNTHGVYVNSMIAAAMAFNLDMQGTGCLASIELCNTVWEILPDPSSLYLHKVCADAASTCRSGVEFPYLTYSEAGDPYDVRNITENPLPPGHWTGYVNTAPVQDAIGTNLNYTVGTSANLEILAAMQGDWVRNVFVKDVAELLDAGIRVQLWYGDVDYVCNWFGGEMASLGINYTNAETFRKSGYTRFEVDGTYYGDTREAGNLAFTRIFDAGHAIPYYQPEATLALFNRSINGLDSAKGTEKITPEFATVGSEKSTYSQIENAKKTKREESLNSAKFRF